MPLWYTCGRREGRTRSSNHARAKLIMRGLVPWHNRFPRMTQLRIPLRIRPEGSHARIASRRAYI